MLGAGLAWLVGAYRFPGSGAFGWALVLPLAMPSYILGFLMLSTFGRHRAGPGHVADLVRPSTPGSPRSGRSPARSSRSRSCSTRTCTCSPGPRCATRPPAAYHAARTLGAGAVPRRPGAWCCRWCVRRSPPGAAVVMMETLTDFATVQYFGVDTVTVGVFRIWRGTYDRDAASEIATLVLGLRPARHRPRAGRLAAGPASARRAAPAAGIEPRACSPAWRAVAATAICGAVVLLAFVGPVVQLSVWAIREQTGDRGTPLLDQYPELPLAQPAAGGRHRADLHRGRRRAWPTPGGSAADRVTQLAEPGRPRSGTPCRARSSAMGVMLAIVGVDDLLEADRPRPARCRGHRIVARPGATPTPSGSWHPV